MTDTPKAFLLPAATRDELLRYLGNRPYREVATGMQALLDLFPLPEPDVVPDEKEPV
jgi:hypothetical protein